VSKTVKSVWGGAGGLTNSKTNWATLHASSCLVYPWFYSHSIENARADYDFFTF
jgi:hypothetical protein